MKQIMKLIERLAKWPHLLVSFLLFVAGNVAILPQVTRFEEMTNGMSLLEVPTMLSEDLYAVANAYSPEGLRLYQQVIQPLDIIYPLTAGLFFMVGLVMLTTRLFSADSRWRYLPLIGALATLFDWLENLGVFLILQTLEMPNAIFATMTKLFIVLKFGVSSLSVLLLLGLFLWWVVRRFVNRGA